MQEKVFEILSNREIAAGVWEIRLAGDTQGMERPGQFVNVSLPGFFLRRPISVCCVKEQELTLIYKTVGKGTACLSALREGRLNLLTGLGNGYNLDRAGEAPLLIGGGVGVPPLYELARQLRARDLPVQVILGFNTAREVFYVQEFKDLGCEVTVTTADGSQGVKGFVTDALGGRQYSYVYACGPVPMLKAVDRNIQSDGEFSMEERMGCGFGACMGCSCKTKGGNKRVCREGPVFRKEEILWEA
ncbi:MAG: dihydroorotate dehydrogenase electron transfer subunit [Clostridia bacterium]|nr:dihydroorotate dehydrogenase electron transfer subunit [Clostridia bacterium]